MYAYIELRHTLHYVYISQGMLNIGQLPLMKTVASEDAWRRGVSICIREIANCVSSHLACESGKINRVPRCGSHAKERSNVYNHMCGAHVKEELIETGVSRG